jgi:hypothetical protein
VGDYFTPRLLSSVKNSSYICMFTNNYLVLKLTINPTYTNYYSNSNNLPIKGYKRLIQQ